MTSTFIALGIFIIVVLLAVHVWRSNGSQSQTHGVRLFFNGAEIPIVSVSDIKWEPAEPGAVTVQTKRQLPAFSATIVWNADAPIKVIYPEDDHE